METSVSAHLRKNYLGLIKTSIPKVEYDNLDLLRLKNRHPEELKKLFAGMNPRLLKMLRSQNIALDSMEEVLHECWETFFSNINNFEGRSKLSTFIFGILLNKIREHRRRAQKIDYEEDSEKVFQRSFTIEGWWATEPEDPYCLLANQQLGEAIRECLKGLTANQRDAFLLLESEGESAHDVCQLLGLSISNLRVLIFRAKDKLKSCLLGFN